MSVITAAHDGFLAVAYGQKLDIYNDDDLNDPLYSVSLPSGAIPRRIVPLVNGWIVETRKRQSFIYRITDSHLGNRILIDGLLEADERAVSYNKFGGLAVIDGKYLITGQKEPAVYLRASGCWLILWSHQNRDYITRIDSGYSPTTLSLPDVGTPSARQLCPHPHDALIAWSNTSSGMGVISAVDGSIVSHTTKFFGGSIAWVNDSLLSLEPSGYVAVLNVHLLRICTLTIPTTADGYVYNHDTYRFVNYEAVPQQVHRFIVNGNIVALQGSNGMVAIYEIEPNGQVKISRILVHPKPPRKLKWCGSVLVAIMVGGVATMWPDPPALHRFQFEVVDAWVAPGGIVAWSEKQLSIKKSY